MRALWSAVPLVLILGSPAIRGDDTSRKTENSQAAPGPPGVEIKLLSDSDDGLSETRAAPGYKLAYRKAQDQADVVLKQGHARLLDFGWIGTPDLDPETGLVEESIAGCLVTEEILGRIEGNNDRVRAWIKDHGPPPNSLLRWKAPLSNLPAYFAERAKLGDTIRLQIGGPNLTSPDKRFTLRQVATQVETGTRLVRTITAVGIDVSERGQPRGVLKDESGEGLTELAWGPPGAPFAVVKIGEGGAQGFRALHLQPVEWITPRKLAWLRYLKEHPESPFNKPG